MATSSILKTYEIKDVETYERFLKLQEQPVTEIPPSRHRLEEGEELLKQFSFRSEN